MTTLTQSQRDAFIESLVLADEPVQLDRPIRRHLSTTELVRATDKPTGYVDDGSLVSFVTGITQQRREDVLDSTLLAQLAANAVHDRYKATDAWYKKYIEVLEHACAWVAQDFKFSRYEVSGNTFTVDGVVIKILTALATQNQLLIVKETLDALKGLADKDKRLLVFDGNAQRDGNGSFQIGVCAESGEAIAMNIGAFHFSSTESVKRFLWFKYSTSSSTIFTAKQAMTLNEREYAKHRDKIRAKLGKRIDEYIDELPI